MRRRADGAARADSRADCAAAGAQGSPRTVMHHSPSIAQAADGHLLAVWFGGLWEAQPDASIWLAHLEVGTAQPVALQRIEHLHIQPMAGPAALSPT